MNDKQENKDETALQIEGGKKTLTRPQYCLDKLPKIRLVL